MSDYRDRPPVDAPREMDARAIWQGAMLIGAVDLVAIVSAILLAAACGLIHR